MVFLYFRFQRAYIAHHTHLRAQDGPKTAPRRPKTAPRRPKRAPRRLQIAPKTAQEAPKRPPRRFRDASRNHLGSRICPGSLLGASRTLPGGLRRPLGVVFMSKCWPPTRTTTKTSRVQSRQFPRSIPYQQIPKVLLTHHASLGAGGRGRSPSDIPTQRWQARE